MTEGTSMSQGRGRPLSFVTMMDKQQCIFIAKYYITSNSNVSICYEITCIVMTSNIPILLIHTPPFLHVLPLQSSQMSVSQLTPVLPAGHKHSCPTAVTEHVPWFWHGFGSQSVITIWQNSPMKPWIVKWQRKKASLHYILLLAELAEDCVCSWVIFTAGLSCLWCLWKICDISVSYSKQLFCNLELWWRNSEIWW